MSIQLSEVQQTLEKLQKELVGRTITLRELDETCNRVLRGDVELPNFYVGILALLMEKVEYKTTCKDRLGTKIIFEIKFERDHKVIANVSSTTEITIKEITAWKVLMLNEKSPIPL